MKIKRGDQVIVIAGNDKGRPARSSSVDAVREPRGGAGRERARQAREAGPSRAPRASASSRSSRSTPAT